MTTPDWVIEFDEWLGLEVSYSVPDAITAELADTSWHNDACPSFGTDRLRLWVEHPQEDLREAFSCRFTVVDEPEAGDWHILYQGDDVAAALAAYRAASPDCP